MGSETESPVDMNTTEVDINPLVYGAVTAAAGVCAVIHGPDIAENAEIMEENRPGMGEALKGLPRETQEQTLAEVTAVSLGLTDHFSTQQIQDTVAKMPREGVHAMAEGAQAGKDLGECTINVLTLGMVDIPDSVMQGLKDVSPADRVDYALETTVPAPSTPTVNQGQSQSAPTR